MSESPCNFVQCPFIKPQYFKMFFIRESALTPHAFKSRPYSTCVNMCVVDTEWLILLNISAGQKKLFIENSVYYFNQSLFSMLTLSFVRHALNQDVATLCVVRVHVLHVFITTRMTRYIVVWRKTTWFCHWDQNEESRYTSCKPRVGTRLKHAMTKHDQNYTNRGRGDGFPGRGVGRGVGGGRYNNPGRFSGEFNNGGGFNIGGSRPGGILRYLHLTVG